MLTEFITATEIQNSLNTRANSSNGSSIPMREQVRVYLQERFNRVIDRIFPTDLYIQLMAEVEPPLLEITLRYCNNNQSQAAKRLGISRTTLRKKMKIYGIKSSPLRL